MKLIAFACVLLVAGCTSAVKMHNPATGETTQCGPYPSGGLAGFNTPSRESQCIADYQRQGFERAP